MLRYNYMWIMCRKVLAQKNLLMKHKWSDPSFGKTAENFFKMLNFTKKTEMKFKRTNWILQDEQLSKSFLWEILKEKIIHITETNITKTDNSRICPSLQAEGAARQKYANNNKDILEQHFEFRSVEFK